MGARVNVEASVIDISDLSTLKHKCGDGRHPLPYRFFAGGVVDTGQAEFPVASQVVGWYQGCHCGQVDLPCAWLYRCNATVSPTQSAAEFTCLCVALCIVDEAARDRVGDVFDICLQGPVGATTATLCRESGAETLESDTTGSARFTVDMPTDRGLVINDGPVNIKNYLTSCRGVDMLRQRWKDRKGAVHPVKALNLMEIEESFPQLGPQGRYSTVLNHSNKETACGVTMKAKSVPLFTSDGT